MILGEVFQLTVPLASVDKVVVELPPFVLQDCRGGAAMPGDVGDLVAVVALLRIGDLDGSLVGVLSPQR